jgi:UDP-N-acetylmuramate: L-alanyl-gamma-D-glutamyl-meso-diaminopimelate ligase
MMDLKNLISQEELIQKRREIKTVFFYRICGTGMGAAACLMKEAGYEVVGADSSYSPPMSTYLESTGIELLPLSVVQKEFLQKFDLIIVGNSVSGKSEHARLIEACGVPFTSFPSCIGALVLRDANVVGIAGTHGKTTTTYFLTQLLEKLGQDPGYLVGGIIDGRAPSKLGNRKYFVIESDEYDSAYFHKISKFRLYELKNLILTSLEFDHADIFTSIEKIEDEFRAVLPSMPKTVIMNQEYPSAVKLFKEYQPKSKNSWHMYGEGSKIGPHNIKTFSSGSSFELVLGEEKVTFETNIVGAHNVLNISSCLLYLFTEGFKISDLKNVVKNLEMVKRRQEVRGHYKGATVIDDFAHHPRAIKVTIDAIKDRFPGKKIVTIFEPISATARSSIFQKEFAQTLAASDEVIIAKPDLPTTAIGGADLDGVLLTEDITSHGKKATCVTQLADLRSQIDKSVSAQSVLLILSNRTCLGLWESDFVKQLA